MNSTILCWPTLAPLFQAMNRAVWKKKIHTRSKSSKICLFVMVLRLGEKVILHLVLFYIFFHKQKALSGKGRTLLQKKKKKIRKLQVTVQVRAPGVAPELNCVYSWQHEAAERDGASCGFRVIGLLSHHRLHLFKTGRFRLHLPRWQRAS